VWTELGDCDLFLSFFIIFISCRKGGGVVSWRWDRDRDGDIG
jgi:hypothetical protein